MKSTTPRNDLACLPQHDASTRRVFETLGPWQLLQFPHDDPKLAYFLRKGFFHVQITDREDRVSILSPSRLSGGRWEVFAGGSRRWALRDLGAVNLCLLHLGFAPLPQAKLLAILRSHQHDPRLAPEADGRARNEKEKS